MKFTCISTSEKTFIVTESGREHSLSDVETVDIDCMRGTPVTVRTQKAAALSKKSAVALFFGRLVAGFFNMIFNSSKPSWYWELDPFVMLPYALKAEDEMTFKYAPAKITKRKGAFKIEKPRVAVNKQPIQAEFAFDKNAVDRAFLSYIFDLFTAYFYNFCVVAFSWIFGFSHATYWAVALAACVGFLLLLGGMLAFKAVRCYKEKSAFFAEFEPGLFNMASCIES